MKLDFSKVELNEGPGRILPGVEEVIIESVEESTMPFKTEVPSVAITFRTLNGKNVHKENLNMSEEPLPKSGKSPAEYTMNQLKHIASKVATTSEVDSVKNLTQLSSLLVGKRVRIKFAGRERMINGNIRVITQLPLYRFAEEITTNPTSLRYDKSNTWDYKKVTVTQEEVTSPF